MAKFIARQLIEDAEAKVEHYKRAYLIKFGWECTSNTPGAFWLWRRDFADVDAQRAAWEKEVRAGEPGRPSKMPPYGVITAPVDLACSITLRALDREIDQDGDPETPEILEDEAA